MSSFVLITISTIISFFIVDRNDVHIRIVKISQDSEASSACFQVELSQEGLETMTLASQNYRLYFNSDNLKLSKENIRLLVPENAYQLKVIQNLGQLDASGYGPLSFESNLGFANFSVVYQDGSPQGIMLSRAQGWLKVVELCFEVESFHDPANIVLARTNMTANYGKAFIELSAYDSDHKITSARIKSYTDFSVDNLH